MTMKKYTTLNEIKKHKPCNSGWKKLLEYTEKTKPDNRPLSFRRILLSNGIQDAVWALRVLSYKDRCMFAHDVAQSVLHIFEKVKPNDKRPRLALEAIVKFKNDEINGKELKDAARAAYAAVDAATNTAYASFVATTTAAVDAAYIASAAANAHADAAYGAANAYAARAAATADAATVHLLDVEVDDAHADARENKWIEIETLYKKYFT